MNKDFEFRQLLRAYRQGIISESTFDEEVGTLENGVSGNGPRFSAFGKTFGCERDAVLYFLDRFGSAEGAAEVSLRKWEAVSKTDCVRGGLRMVAEREGYHSRVFERRLLELGGTKKEDGSDVARQLSYYSDPNLSDADKLLRATSLSPDPKTILQPIFDFGESIKEDLLTKEMVLLYAKDELASGTWAYEACALLNNQTSRALA
jgi:hypothetical protein